MTPSIPITQQVERIHKLSTILQAAGIKHWIDFGTLLGAVRGGGLVQTDIDFDFGVLRPDDERLLALRDEIRNVARIQLVEGVLLRGCPVHDSLVASTERRALQSCLKAGLLYMDFYVWDTHGRDVVPVLQKFRPYSFKAYFIDELEFIHFEGFPFPAPRHRAELLAHRYGLDWRIPMPKDEYFKVIYQCIRPFEGIATAYVPLHLRDRLSWQPKILERGKSLFDRVLVGVHAEEAQEHCAGPEENLLGANAGSFVDAVIAHPPELITKDFMRQHQIDYILSYKDTDLTSLIKDEAIRTEKVHAISR